jgi:RNA polymerase sigma-70 factor (ECF subfamily)
MLKSTPRVNQSSAQGASDLTLRTLFDTEETTLLRFAFSLIGRRVVAEDIVQDVFLKLHAKWDDVDTPRAWLYRSVRNRAYNYIRDNKREILNSDDHEVVSPDPEAETMILRIEATGALRQMLEELDEVDRQLVKLKYFENLKYRDISAQTGLSIGNVGYRLHHILKELGSKLRPLGIDELS